jgi:maltooligosyltrehalose trehalohydrolase
VGGAVSRPSTLRWDAVRRRLGATPVAGGARFEVWAPQAGTVTVELDGRSLQLHPDHEAGTWVGIAAGVGHGDRYRIRLDDREPLADPASGWQPDGLEGPSAVVDPDRFTWTDDAWTGIALEDSVLYELHVGTFTPEGTLDAAIDELPRLAALGISHVELMPVNQFQGSRNWGYDGVLWSAVQHTYGGPEALARFVDAAHAAGLGVVLDVVYNHVGPIGNHVAEFGPYFTDAVHLPWGQAINVAGPGSDMVRRTIIENGCRWIEDFHVDGLRVDAIHAIHDPTARPVLDQLVAAVHDAGAAADRTVLAIAESSDNDPRVVRPPAIGGLGFDAVWNDDLHHALRVTLTGDRRGYYGDYGGVADMATVLARRWLFIDRWSAYRGRTHGRAADDAPPARFVVFTSDHDQVGNTPDGARPPFDCRQRLVAAATVLLSAFTPMLFMGEEYGEPAPFPFFVDHGDPELLEATRKGRIEEFRHEWTEAVADPGDVETFRSAVIDPSQANAEPHRTILAAYTELIALRRRHPVLRGDAEQTVTVSGETIVVERRRGSARSVLVLGFASSPSTVAVDASGLMITFDSAASLWGGDDSTSVGDGAVSVDGPAAVLFVSA